MITKCRFCEFRRETPLSVAMLELLQEELPEEDFLLWLERLVASTGNKDWDGVKVHMGRMHKADAYYGMWPDTFFSDDETIMVDKIKWPEPPSRALQRLA
jgi:hypothetical protein